MKKGDIVLVEAVVFTKEHHYKVTKGTKIDYEFFVPSDLGHSGIARRLSRVTYAYPWKGMIVGKSYLISGIYQAGHGYDDPGDLWNQTHHSVWLVEPLDTIRWIRPYACREEDLGLLQPETLVALDRFLSSGCPAQLLNEMAESVRRI